MTEEAGSVVLLSESEAGSSLAERLTRPGRRVTCYDSLEALVRGEPVTSIGALVVHSRDVPNGRLLATLGRLAVEHPGVAKVVVLESAPPLPVASYLAACGVALLWPDSAANEPDRLAALLERIHEGTKWIAMR